MVGVCICEHHGRAGLADVCIHVAEAVSSGSPTHDIVSARFRMGRFSNQQDAEVIFTLSYCQACAMDHGFPTSDSDLFEGAWERVVAGDKFTGVCGQCLREAIKR